MARSGNGTYSLPSGQPAITGTTISSTTFNTLTADIATALTQSLAYDGQTVPVANLPMGGYKLTGLGAGTALTDAAQVAQVQSGAVTWLSSVSGADTITASISPNPAAYAAGQTFRFVSAGANTGAVTLNISSLGAKSVTKNGTTALVAGDIPSGAVVTVTYDGTQFQVSTITPASASQAEMEAGTEAALRSMSPLRVAQAIAALASSGKFAQIQTTALSTVSTGTTVIPFDNTVPQNTEGDQYLSVTITPQNASSTLEIDVEINIASTVSLASGVCVALFQDSTAGALAANGGSQPNGQMAPFVIHHVMTAGTTSATTFKVRAGSGGAGTMTVNGQSGTQYFGGVASSRITVKEYLP